MAAPSKLTPDRKKRILEAIALGATYELAAQYGGVSYNTFNSWMKEGAAAKSGGKVEFFRQVKEAEGKAAAKWLAKIEQAASDGAWQAAAWKLERRYPAAYGRQDRVSGALHLEHSQGTELKVVEDGDWYPTADRLRSEAAGASSGSSAAPRAIQDNGVRKALGQNGDGDSGSD